MLAVTIFALAVLALGRCMDNCMRAELALREDDRARRALENRMAEIECGAVTVGDPQTDELKDLFEGMKIKQSREEMSFKNENDQEVQGIDRITLNLSWKSHGEERAAHPAVLCHVARPLGAALRCWRWCSRW